MQTNYVLKLAQVKDRLSLSRSSIYQLVKTGELKPPISLGARRVGWLDSDISEFIENRVKASRKA